MSVLTDIANDVFSLANERGVSSWLCSLTLEQGNINNGDGERGEQNEIDR